MASPRVCWRLPGGRTPLGAPRGAGLVRALEVCALGHGAGVDGGSGPERQAPCSSTMPDASLGLLAGKTLSLTKLQSQALLLRRSPRRCSAHPSIPICRTLFKHPLCAGHLGVAFKASRCVAPVYPPALPRPPCLHRVGPPASASPGLEVVLRGLRAVGEEPAKARSWLGLPQGRASTQC